MSTLSTDEPTMAPLLQSRGRLSDTTRYVIYAVAALVGLAFGLATSQWALAVLIAVIVAAVAVPIVSSRVEGRRRAKDRWATSLVTLAFTLAILPLVSVLWLITSKGLARMDVEFFTSDMRGVLGEGGGALHAIVGTASITLGAAVISIPIGVMCAIYLVEYGNKSRLSKAVTFFVDVMTGIPSIVAGLFAFAFFALFFGPSIRFGLAGSVALSVLMIPVVVRSVEEMLKIVPNELREASYALGVSRWRTIVKVVLPTAAAGIAAGITLSVARVIGETAPLLIVAGATAGLNTNLFDGRMMSLPVFTYNSYTIQGAQAQPNLDRAWAAALTLMLIVMLLNLVARLVARKFGTRQTR